MIIKETEFQPKLAVLNTTFLIAWVEIVLLIRFKAETPTSRYPQEPDLSVKIIQTIKLQIIINTTR